MRVAKTIKKKLIMALRPDELHIEDESQLHSGHSGARSEGESHFRVKIVSDAFVGMSRIERQRSVYHILADEMQSDIHALALTTLTRSENK